MQKYWLSPLTFKVTLKAGWQQWLDCWPGLSAWWESPRYVLSESLHSFCSNCKQLHKAGLLTSLLGNRFRTGMGIHSSGTMRWVGSQPKISFRPWDLVTWIQGSVLSSWWHHASCCRAVSQHCSWGRALEGRHRSTASIPPVACLLLAVPYLFI